MTRGDDKTTEGDSGRGAVLVLLAWVENFCFAFALFFLIPPVPSDAGQRYRPAYVLCGLLMIGSRVAARYAGRESAGGTVFKVLVVLVAAWAVNVRVFEY